MRKLEEHEDIQIYQGQGNTDQILQTHERIIGGSSTCRLRI